MRARDECISDFFVVSCKRELSPISVLCHLGPLLPKDFLSGRSVH